MANRPHPDKQAVTWRLHRDLVAAVQAAAAARGETVLAFATRALQLEIDAGQCDCPDDDEKSGPNIWRVTQPLLQRIAAGDDPEMEIRCALVTGPPVTQHPPSTTAGTAMETAVNTCAECGDVICPACDQHNSGHCQYCWACPGDRHDECCED
jgi:hypothetical protein